MRRVFCKIVLICFVAGCGTHGSIKEYRYPTTNDHLANAVMYVIRNNPNIYRDTTQDRSWDSTLRSVSKDSNNSNVDYTTNKNYYNDGKHYVTIKIKKGQIENEYIFRYYGDEADWRNATSAAIFICYAYDKDGNGGSDGNGKVSGKMAKEFTDFFEKEFVDKISAELHLAPTETN